MPDLTLDHPDYAANHLRDHNPYRGDTGTTEVN